jgi:Uma2 family endonuclease
MTRVTSPGIRFTAAEYEKMADAGVFGDRRVELINGRIYRMSPQRDPHMIAISKITELLLRVKLPSDSVFIQGTIRFDRFNVPDLDFMWFDVPLGTPEAQRPRPFLVIEVSHTTYKKDSGPKLRMYAQHGIRDYWIVNTRARRVEVNRDPENPSGVPADCRYDSVKHFTRGQSIALLQRPQVSLAVDDLLP